MVLYTQRMDIYPKRARTSKSATSLRSCPNRIFSSATAALSTAETRGDGGGTAGLPTSAVDDMISRGSCIVAIRK